VREDFNDELRNAAGALAAETQVAVDPVSGPVIDSPRLDDFAMADDAVISVVDDNGQPLATTNRAARLGPPTAEVADRGDLRVATEPIGGGSIPFFVQYARPDSDVEATISRLWLFLLASVAGGTLLALLAGLTVADRAMRPIASLTALARDITATRDPSRRMPVHAADDEVGELARTMDGMLEALDETRAERERAFERQREFVADASHELRTPLTSVQANLELLQASLPGGEDRHAVDSALGSTRRMSRLVSDLLLLARADAGRRTARTGVDLAEVATAARDEVEPLLGDRKLEIALEDSLPVDGNPDELHRLVLNLLENAARHTPPGTTISLSARRDGAEAVIEVADDGHGIAKELGDQVFQRFVRGQGPADTAGSGGGSGLGLAIVRAVAESHGGSVTAGASPHGGALFVARLPLSDEERAPSRSAPRAEAAPRPSRSSGSRSSSA
ncbi:MAG: HAMP domain-containing histidine kinase, partial [Actinomycetota bacterium]|nr:HAMP domain-containing histidine kinase [Actinomycetota bacterium]